MIIWISSFPKSGNTWLRAMISSLIYSKDGIFNFKYLDKISQFPLQKHFEEFTKNFQDLNEIKKFWILAQDKLNLDNQIKLLKTHQINCSIDGYSFTNKENVFFGAIDKKRNKIKINLKLEFLLKSIIDIRKINNEAKIIE